MVTAELLEVAFAIGARLARDAVWADDRCTWLALDVVGPRPTDEAVRLCAHDLYAGASGIGYFLADLHRLTQEPLFRVVASGALRHALRVGTRRADGALLSVYAGRLGTIAAALHVAERCGDDGLAARAMEAVASLAGEPEHLDVVSGAAGAIPVLLAIHATYGVEDARVLALRCGEALLAAGVATDRGLSWPTIDGADRNLTGFAHGAAGVAWALTDLHAATGDPRFREAALSAFAYENSWFVASERNWPDFRAIARGPHAHPVCSLAWCHGAPGIAIARLRAVEIFGDDGARGDAVLALERTAADVAATRWDRVNVSLCHGLPGNAEIVLTGARQLQRDDLRAVAVAAAEGIVATHPRAASSWRSGLPSGRGTLGLMLGVAGTGHFLLRCADEEATGRPLALARTCLA